MTILATILIIFSLVKLYVAGTQEKQELATDMFYQLKDNLEDFQKRAVFILIIDSIVGLAGGVMLFTL